MSTSTECNTPAQHRSALGCCNHERNQLLRSMQMHLTYVN